MATSEVCPYGNRTFSMGLCQCNWCSAERQNVRKRSRWELREQQMSNIARHIPCPPFERAGTRCVCEECGAEYVNHPQAVPYVWLNVLCDGRYVKL